jgi:release factor glutamine methyltransferase
MYPPRPTQARPAGPSGPGTRARTGGRCWTGSAERRRAGWSPGGTLLIVHSSVCGEARTQALLEAHGLEVDVMARETGGLGPLMAARAETLERRGLIEPGQRDEEILVMRARASGTAPEPEHLLSARVSSA